MSNFWTAGGWCRCAKHHPARTIRILRGIKAGDPGDTLVLARAAGDVEPKLKAIPALTAEKDDDDDDDDDGNEK